MRSSSQIITNKPSPGFLQAGCPSCHPYSVGALKECGKHCTVDSNLLSWAWSRKQFQYATVLCGLLLFVILSVCLIHNHSHWFIKS